MIPKRKLGKTGVEVSCVGLGGEGILRTQGHEQESRAVIDRALELGITYFETARTYADSETYLGRCLGSKRQHIFLSSQAHDRTAAGALNQLDKSLRNLRTDWLDLWMIQDVRTDDDLQKIFGPRGVLEAFMWAKKEGKVRFIGISGQQDPDTLLQAITLYDFDAVLMPVNPAEPAWLSFPDTVLPEARKRDMGIIGTKVFCRGFGPQLPGQGNFSLWVRYALGYDFSTLAIGCDTPEHVAQNTLAAQLSPLDFPARRALENAVVPWAKKLMNYKISRPRGSSPKTTKFRPLQ